MKRLIATMALLLVVASANAQSTRDTSFTEPKDFGKLEDVEFILSNGDAMVVYRTSTHVLSFRNTYPPLEVKKGAVIMRGVQKGGWALPCYYFVGNDYCLNK